MVMTGGWLVFGIVLTTLYNWLVVSTPLKNISQWEGLSHAINEMENKSHVPNHQPDIWFTWENHIFTYHIIYIYMDRYIKSPNDG